MILSSNFPVKKFFLFCMSSERAIYSSSGKSYLSNLTSNFSQVRISHRRCIKKKGVLKNFAKFLGIYSARASFLNKVAGLRFATLLKKRFWHCEFCDIFRNTFFTLNLWWLPLAGV